MAPTAMLTVDGLTVTLDGSLLASASVTPPAGAGTDKDTGSAADWPTPSVPVAGKLIEPKIATVTVAAVSARFGSALAWMCACPAATLVTGTAAVVPFAAKVTVAGTVATEVLSELRVTVSPAGAGPDRESVRF